MSDGVFGIIAPHPPIMVDSVGGERSHVTDASSEAMREAARLLKAFDPDVIAIMSPHAPGLADAFAVETAERLEGDLGRFGAPRARITAHTDTGLARAFLDALESEGVPAVDRATVPGLHSGQLDHGVVVPMSYLDPAGRWPLLVISLSWLPYREHRRLGHVLARVAATLGRRLAFVASGDCSHRLTPDAPSGYDPQAAAFDRELVEHVSRSDFDGLSTLDPALVERAGECGLRSFITLGAVAEPAEARVLAYEGPWGVGYLTAVVNERALTPASGQRSGSPGADATAIVSLARSAIEHYVERGEVIEPTPLDDPDMPGRAGVFVSLHRDGMLRGCIGTIGPTRPTLAEEVVANAIRAATADPRFPPLTPRELLDLDVKVDVLHAPEGCRVEDLDPAVYGVIVGCGHRRGLLLPDLEGVDTVQAQLDIACRKAGIRSDERFEIERFKVDRHA